MHYINGKHNLMHEKFIIYTDHFPLKYYLTQPKLSDKFQFKILYKQGKINVVADAISRRADFRDEQKDTFEPVSKLKFNNRIKMHTYIAFSIDATKFNKLFEECIENGSTYKQMEIKTRIDLVQHNNKIYKQLSPSKIVLVISDYLPLKNFIFDAFHSSK